MERELLLDPQQGWVAALNDGTLEVILAQPIGRDTYYVSLSATIALGVTAVLACSLAGGLLARALVDLPGDLPISTLFHLTASGWALSIAVGGIALLASVVGAGGGRATTMAIGTVVAMFFVRFLSDMVPNLAWLRWVSVFGYHDPPQVISNGLAAGHVFALVALGITCAGIGLLLFRRKQLTF